MYVGIFIVGIALNGFYANNILIAFEHQHSTLVSVGTSDN